MDDQGTDAKDELISVEESVEVLYENGPHQMESNWQGGECGKTFIEESLVKEHLNDAHKEEEEVNNQVGNCKDCKEAKTH